jgi:hypothetical protein
MSTPLLNHWRLKGPKEKRELCEKTGKSMPYLSQVFNQKKLAGRQTIEILREADPAIQVEWFFQ